MATKLESKVNLRIPAGFEAYLNAEAARQGVTKSRVLRTALAEAIQLQAVRQDPTNVSIKLPGKMEELR